MYVEEVIEADKVESLMKGNNIVPVGGESLLNQCFNFVTFGNNNIKLIISDKNLLQNNK